MKKWTQGRGQLLREVKSNLEWLSLKSPTLCLCELFLTFQVSVLFSFVVSPMPPLPPHKSPLFPWGHLLSHLCSQSLLHKLHSSICHIILYSSSLFDLQINWGLLSLFTLDTFPVTHVNSISEFHSLNHLADDLSGYAVHWTQWERYRVVKTQVLPSVGSKDIHWQVEKWLIKDQSPIIKPEILISAIRLMILWGQNQWGEPRR